MAKNLKSGIFSVYLDVAGKVLTHAIVVQTNKILLSGPLKTSWLFEGIK